MGLGFSRPFAKACLSFGLAVFSGLTGSGVISVEALADDRVTHSDVIAKHPWIMGLGQIWVRSVGKEGYPPNQVPMYGGVPKNDAMRASDKAFFDRVRELGATPSEGAPKFTVLGFRYFARRDLATAIKRFNQAWMLDPTLGDVYHGFALVLIERDRDVINSERFFKIATGIDNTGPRAFADYGRSLLMTDRANDAIPVLRKAVKKGPGLASAHAWLGTALFQTGNIGEACEIAKQNSDGAEGAAQRLFAEILNARGCAAQ